MVSEDIRTRWAEACKAVRKRANGKVSDPQTHNREVPKEYRVYASSVSNYENNGEMPSFLKIWTMGRGYGVPIAEFYKEMGATNAEICGHSLTPQQQAVVDQLNTDNGEYLLKLRWLFAEGQEKHQRMIKDQLDELSKEAPADALAPPEAVTDLTDPEALAAPKGELIEFPTGAKPIVVHRLATAAGSGALDLDESIKTYAWFRSEWLSRKGLVADQCAIISVMGESMDPALPDGCVILIDRNRTRRRSGQIFVVRTEDGLIVKRLGKDEQGNWQLLSDHEDWEPAPWPEDAVIIGEVKWSAVEW